MNSLLEHDPALTYAVETANDPATDFPIQSLPFRRFRCTDDALWRIGVAGIPPSRIDDARQEGEM